MTKLLDQAVEIARSLPSDAQDDIARVVLELAGADDAPPVALTDDERAAIAASKEAAARGEFATEEQVRAIWAKHGLKPHRLERYMASNDPQFEAKAADVIGLYLNPPAHAAVFCVDEKTAIQALDRLDPVLPLSPGRLERHGFEYYRHGTVSLYAAFNTKTGEVLGKTAARHTSAEFVAFLADICTRQPKRKEIHVICDNLSAHKTPRVEAFVLAHPNVHLHYTPTYSSWLNQVELWFAKIERDVIARGIFTSVADLEQKLRNFLDYYNATMARPFHWTYTGKPLHKTPRTDYCPPHRRPRKLSKVRLAKLAL